MTIATLIMRQQFRRAMGVSGETVRRWLASGRLPQPDYYVTDKVNGWRLDTLEAAGFKIAAPQNAEPTSETEPCR